MADTSFAQTPFGKFLLGSAQNVNTDYASNPIYKMLFGEGGQYANMQGGMDSYLQAMQSFLANAVSSAKAYDPNAFWKDFMAAQPEMQALISGPMGSYKSAAEANLADFVKEATSQTGAELSGMGALYSGAFGDILGTRVGKEAAKTGVDMAQLQANLLSQLWGNALPQFAGGEQFKTKSLIDTYLGGASEQLGGANLYSQQLASMLGIGADLSTPLYRNQPGLFDYASQALGLGLQGLGAFGMLNKNTTSTGDQSSIFSRLGFSSPTVGVGAMPWYPQ